MSLPRIVSDAIIRFLNSQPEPTIPQIRRCCFRHERHDLQIAYGTGWVFQRLFIVCGTCGNKRCPKASDCALDCTGSNASGQAGSVFGEVSE